MKERLMGPVSALADGGRLVATVDGTEIVVFQHGSDIYALENTCLHMGGPVGEGLLLGRVEGEVAPDGRYLGDRFSDEVTHIVCPWHGWEYDIATGRCAALPQLALRRFDTEVREGHVYVRA